MTHFGIIGPPVPGHINPFLALAHELQSRGHRVTFLQISDLEDQLRSEEVGFAHIGTKDHPLGSLQESLAQLGRLSGLAALRFTVREIGRTTATIFQDGPAAVKNAGIDVLLVDQTEPAGSSLAEFLGLPFVTVCNALVLHREPAIPPPFTGWSYRNTLWARMRNRLGYAISDQILSPVHDLIADHRKRWRLPAYKNLGESFSSLAQISQQPREFDFPRQQLPDCFHYVGPLRWPARRPVEFPWEWLDGRPLVYASLGTLQNKYLKLFHCFAEACGGLDVQLVMAGADDGSLGLLPENVLAVPYAPQLQLLQKASLTLSHGGLNTVLDSLANGVPLIVLPITYEQPAIAQRVRWVGAGEILTVAGTNPDKLRRMVRRLLGENRYKMAAQHMAASIQAAGGVKKAGVLIEALTGISS